MEYAVLSSFVLALAAPWIYRAAGSRASWILALGPAGLFCYFVSLSGQVADEPVVVTHDWVPSAGVTLAFYLDGLSLLFALLITGIGTLVFVYAGGYLAGHRDIGKFFGFLSLFMGSMLGLVLADNLFLLFVFWELTSISSYLLIGFDHEDAASRAAAQQALLVTNAGALAMLAGMVMLAQVSETSQISALADHAAVIHDDSLYLPILLLILAGAFTKSAQFPFHFWLPNAMAAPTPVSAYLHSATMVKAGIYLLARLSPTLGGTDAWLVIVTAAGAITMVIGGVIAVHQTDLKRVLAYSTVSALGTLVLLLGLHTPEAAAAAIVFLLAHALYKAGFFMTAGAIEHGTGTRDIDRLRGLWRAMPLTAAIGALAAVSLAGFGPVISFVGKELLLESVLHADRAKTMLVGAVVVAGALFVLTAGFAGVRPFVGKVAPTPKHPHDAPLMLLGGPALLVAMGVVFGVAPGLVEGRLVTPAVAAVTGSPAAVHLSLWHGFNTAFTLSVISLVLGVSAYLAWPVLRQATRPLDGVASWGADRGYTGVLSGIKGIASWHTRTVQNGYLRVYLMVTIATAFGLSGYTLLARAELEDAGGGTVHSYHVGLAMLMIGAAAVTAVTRSRLAAVAALGVVGYGVALTYVLHGAPDLAMTQVMVETLTVILFLSVLFHLPTRGAVSSLLGRARDATIALAAGGFVTVLVLVATANRSDSPVASYYAEQSVPLAHGRNVVNVILVDFRALDTLGEITVLAAAAFGVYALLGLRPRPPREGADDV